MTGDFKLAAAELVPAPYLAHVPHLSGAIRNLVECEDRGDGSIDVLDVVAGEQMALLKRIIREKRMAYEKACGNLIIEPELPPEF